MKDCPKCSYSNHEGDDSCYNCGYVFFVENVGNYDVAQALNSNNNYQGNHYNFVPQMQSPLRQSQVYVKTNGNAKVAFTLGLLSIPLKCGIDIILSVLSILFGIFAILGIILSFGKEKGLGYAITGIILSFITILIYVFFVIPYIMKNVNI